MSLNDIQDELNELLQTESSEQLLLNQMKQMNQNQDVDLQSMMNQMFQQTMSGQINPFELLKLAMQDTKTTTNQQHPEIDSDQIKSMMQQFSQSTGLNINITDNMINKITTLSTQPTSAETIIEELQETAKELTTDQFKDELD